MFYYRHDIATGQDKVILKLLFFLKSSMISQESDNITN